MYCQFFGRYYYNAIYPGTFYRSHTFPCRSLLLSTTILNDNIIYLFFESSLKAILNISWKDWWGQSHTGSTGCAVPVLKHNALLPTSWYTCDNSIMQFTTIHNYGSKHNTWIWCIIHTSFYVSMLQLLWYVTGFAEILHLRTQWQGTVFTAIEYKLTNHHWHTIKNKQVWDCFLRHVRHILMLGWPWNSCDGP